MTEYPELWYAMHMFLLVKPHCLTNWVQYYSNISELHLHTSAMKVAILMGFSQFSSIPQTKFWQHFPVHHAKSGSHSTQCNVILADTKLNNTRLNYCPHSLAVTPIPI